MRALFLLLVPMFAFAGPPDVEIWTSGALEYEATDSLSFELREHLRVNPTPLTAEVLTDVGVEFRAAEFLRLAAAYRIGMVDIGDAAELRHRMAFDVVAPVKLDALRVSLRQRYQARIGTAHNSPKHVLRTRLMAKLKGDLPVHPYASLEPFFEVGEGLSKWRTTLGAQVPLERVKLGLYYRLELPTAVEDGNTHIGGVTVKWTLP